MDWGTRALEEEREFSNRSVTGGIDKFIQRHARAIIEELGDSGIHRILLRIPYRGLTQEERPWWVEQWRAVIGRMQQVSSPEPPNQCSPTPSSPRMNLPEQLISKPTP